MKDDGGPAFPVHLETGMSLRDFFAGQALAGMANHTIPETYIGFAADKFNRIKDATAASAYQYADAMLKARAS